MNDYAVKTIAAREKFAERMTTAGLGVGALLNVKSWRNHEHQLAMVEDIMWDYLTHESALGEVRQNTDLVRSRGLISTSHNPQGERFTGMLSIDVIDINNKSETSSGRNRRQTNYEIASPVDTTFPR